ncbi:PAS domain S-box protein [Nostoc sp. CHAB 5844]|nr:PAS domain S-box protein [Nostoc sp. CHAB 5844]
MANSHPANILLVDDSPANLKALVATLEPLGYNLITALSGKEALKYLLQNEFAVVLLDVQMPEMDGFETAKLIHSRPTTQDLPIIFLTAIYQDLSYIYQGYSTGAVDYLLKPIVPAILLAKVKVFVELFQKTAILKQQAKLLAATNSKLEAEIKQRQIALEKLRESEARFQAFMDNSPILAWITDTTGRVLFLSQSYLHKFKLLVEEPIGKFIFDLYPNEIAQHFLNNIQKVAETDRVIETIEVAPRINDTFGIFLVYKFPIPGVSKQKLVGGVALDITDRKRMEDALRESEEKFRQLAENIQAVFWMTDIHNQQFLYVSKAYETIWQRSCEDVYQNASAWLDAVHPDDRSCVELELVEQAKTGQSDKRYRIIRSDGSIRWIRDRAFPIKNELGEMVRIAGIAEDITDQHRIEQMKSEFIGIVSHELRTPLTSIRAAMGLLNSGVYERKPDKSKRMIEIAAIDCERLVRLVNDILDLERLESGRAVLEKTTCDATDLIQQAVAGVQAIAKQQNIIFDIHATEAQVWAATDAIIQTLTNLLGNAIKFSPANATITLSVQQQTDCVLFKISDRGRGIPADKLEAIFGRFQQVDASDSRVKGGTGLGLAICRSIIEQHGGKIWAESTVGVGSTFFFTLPKNREQVTGDRLQGSGELREQGSRGAGEQGGKITTDS